MYLQCWPSMVLCVLFRLCEMTAEETVAQYMAAVLTFTRAITEEGVTTLQADHDQLVAFFQQHCKADKVVKLAAPLQHLKDVAAADSVDTFVLTYTTLLQVCCLLGCPKRTVALGFEVFKWIWPNQCIIVTSINTLSCPDCADVSHVQGKSKSYAISPQLWPDSKAVSRPVTALCNIDRQSSQTTAALVGCAGKLSFEIYISES